MQLQAFNECRDLPPMFRALSSADLDWDGNDFLIGIVGRELHGVSDAVERRRFDVSVWPPG